MKTSCRFAMAVHVLALLGHKNDELVCSEALATSVNTNAVVIRRLLRALQEAKLIRTRKGAGYGSRLSRPARAIDLAQVFRAVECDPLFAMPRRKPDARCAVGKGIGVALERVFGSAWQAVERDLARTTLAELLEIVTRRERAGRGEKRRKQPKRNQKENSRRLNRRTQTNEESKESKIGKSDETLGGPGASQSGASAAPGQAGFAGRPGAWARRGGGRDRSA